MNRIHPNQILRDPAALHAAALLSALRHQLLNGNPGSIVESFLFGGYLRSEEVGFWISHDSP
jgi:hypothetical protein